MVCVNARKKVQLLIAVNLIKERNLLDKERRISSCSPDERLHRLEKFYREEAPDLMEMFLKTERTREVKAEVTQDENLCREFREEPDFHEVAFKRDRMIRDRVRDLDNKS